MFPAIVVVAAIAAGCDGADGNERAEDEPAADEAPEGEDALEDPQPETDEPDPDELEPEQELTAEEDDFTDGDLVEPEVADEVAVVYGEYGLPDTTGYATAVAFTATNPTEAIAPDVRYRVELLDANGETMDRSDGTDVFTLQPGATREIVHMANPSGESPPVDATISVFETLGFQPGQDQFDAIDPDDWTVENAAVTCDEGLVGCDATGDLTWDGDGDEEAEVLSITVIVRDGGPDDEVVAAGSGSGEIDTLLRPGQTFPFRVLVQGIRSADDSLHIDTYVEALPLFVGDF